MNNRIVRIILAVIVGVVVGGIVNYSIVIFSHKLMPLGFDVTNEVEFKNNIHLLTPAHYIMSFLAHALGTLVGALVAAKVAISNRLGASVAVGIVFLIGGIMMAQMVDAPEWFEGLDVVLAYLPMSALGWKLSSMIGRKK